MWLLNWRADSSASVAAEVGSVAARTVAARTGPLQRQSVWGLMVGPVWH